MGERTTDEARYGYWFPLVLLGFGMLVLLGWESVRTPEDFGWFAYGPAASETENVDTITAVAISSAPGGTNSAVPLLAISSFWDWTWPALITVTLVGTVAWYAVRARRAGQSVRRHVVVAAGGGVAVWACHVVAGIAHAVADSGELIPSVGLPLVTLGVLAGAWAYLRPGPKHRTAATISVGCLVAGVAVLLGAWSPGLLDPVFLAGGLLALALFERSRLVAVVACLVLVARLVIPDGTLSTLVPAVVVLAAAIVALVRRNSVVTGYTG